MSRPCSTVTAFPYPKSRCNEAGLSLEEAAGCSSCNVRDDETLHIYNPHRTKELPRTLLSVPPPLSWPSNRVKPMGWTSPFKPGCGLLSPPFSYRFQIDSSDSSSSGGRVSDKQLDDQAPPSLSLSLSQSPLFTKRGSTGVSHLQRGEIPLSIGPLRLHGSPGRWRGPQPSENGCLLWKAAGLACDPDLLRRDPGEGLTARRVRAVCAFGTQNVFLASVLKL